MKGKTAFYFWRREIVRRDAQVRASGPAPSTFVELHAIPVVALAPEPSPAIELLLPRDRRLVLRSGFDAALLRQVLSVLEDRSC